MPVLRNGFMPKRSFQLAKAADVVMPEDFNMKGMPQALSYGKSVSDNGSGMFMAFLGCKLAEQGERPVKINTWR